MIKGEELSFGESASGRQAVEAASKTPPKTPPKTPQKTPQKSEKKLLPTATPTPTPMKRPSTSGALLKRPAAAEEELQVEDEQAVEEKVEEKQPKSGSGANVISSISHKAGWKEQMVETKSGRKYARYLDKDGKQFFSRAKAIENGFRADKKWTWAQLEDEKKSATCSSQTTSISPCRTIHDPKHSDCETSNFSNNTLLLAYIHISYIIYIWQHILIQK